MRVREIVMAWVEQIGGGITIDKDIGALHKSASLGPHHHAATVSDHKAA